MGLNIELLRQSFAVAANVSDQVADKFYEFLFEDFPQVKPMFKDVKLQSQKKALINSLVFIVDNLDNGDKLSEYLRQMGKRHVDYGTAPEHYDAVGATLLKTFAYFFKDDWTDELHNEWANAYGIITEHMLEGAKYAEPTEDTIIKRARIHANNILLNALDEQLHDGELEEKIRLTVRKMIFEILDAEYNKMLNDKKAA